MKICIDPGHGGRTTGAVGKFSIEKNITLKLALMLNEELKECGIDTVMTRTSDVYVSLGERCRIANRADCDYFISVHCNGFRDPQANGTSTYHFPGSRKGSALAAAIQKASVEYNGNRNRGVKTAGFYVLRYTKMPAVLLETAFITNEREEKMLNSKSWQEGYVKTIANTVCEFVGIPPYEEKILYRVYRDGEQIGAFHVKDNAFRLAETTFGEISQGVVKVVTSKGEVLMERAK